MILHPDSRRLARALKRCLPQAISWSGSVYRSASPRYANEDDILTGAGARRAGARWNPPNSFLTVYTSLDPHTALDEALAHFLHYGLPVAKALPRVLVSLETRVRRVLDLTDARIRRFLSVSERRLLDEPWREMQIKSQEALTQALGRLAYEDGWEGLLAPSTARKGGVNLMLFPANIEAPESWMRISNKAELPRRF
jgi:RES domain-containing protein